MNENEMKSFLSRPYALGRDIRRKEILIAELRAGLFPGAIRYDRECVQTSPTNQQERIIARIVDLEREVEQLRADRAEATLDVCRAVDELENERDREVLTYYYANGMRADEIADIMHFSDRQVFRIRRRAVQSLARKMSVNVSKHL